jgi:hypothetical protein
VAGIDPRLDRFDCRIDIGLRRDCICIEPALHGARELGRLALELEYPRGTRRLKSVGLIDVILIGDRRQGLVLYVVCAVEAFRATNL